MMFEKVSKFDLAVMLIAIGGGAFWIESGNRTRINMQTGIQLAAPGSASVCPDSDNVPYSLQCIAFMEGDADAGFHWRANGTASGEPASRAPAGSPEQVDPPG